MLIDWFTVIAQIINFVILIALLKRFLYKPILKAIDAREKRIAEQLAEADQAKASAEQLQDEFRQKNEQLANQQAHRLHEIEADAAAERTRLLDEARKEARDLAARRALQLERDSVEFEALFQRAMGQATADAAERILKDLSGTDLEERMIDVLLERLPDDIRQSLGSKTPLSIDSAHLIPDQRQQVIIEHIRGRHGDVGPVTFHLDPDLICGIRLRFADQTVLWSLSQHLNTLRGILDETGLLESEPPDGGGVIPITEKKLDKLLENAFRRIRQKTAGLAFEISPVEIGNVVAVTEGIAQVTGLPNIGSDEMVRFENGGLGIALDLSPESVGVMLLCDHTRIGAGDTVYRLHRVMDVAVGDPLLGRVIDPLGQPLDEAGDVRSTLRLPIERQSPAIMDRLPVHEPLMTGIKIIDAMVPVGRGQRELIIGDRKTGKTAIAVDTLINQRDQGVIGIYCAIGQRAASVANVIGSLRTSGTLSHCVVIVAEGDRPPGLAFIAPYAATSIAEYFMRSGRDVLIVYDDLTQHARSYRELSLLLRRPPGREAFPGDIFYIHSRLLERATRLKPEMGGGSLTALPIVETEAQNISAYIPTNLISITDGQIYLSSNKMELGILPAVDIGKSVSRVGGKAQNEAYRSVIGDLKLSFSQFEELEAFARYGAHLDESARQSIEYGRRIQACLTQPERDTVSFEEQLLILVALKDHLFDTIPLDRMHQAQEAVRQMAAHLGPDQRQRLWKREPLDDEELLSLVRLAKRGLQRFFMGLEEADRS